MLLYSVATMHALFQAGYKTMGIVTVYIIVYDFMTPVNYSVMWTYIIGHAQNSTESAKPFVKKCKQVINV